MTREPLHIVGEQVQSIETANPVQWIIDSRSAYAADKLTLGINSGSLKLGVLTGPMAGKKTGTIASILSRLIGGATVYKPVFDNRHDTDASTVWVRNGDAISENVRAVPSLEEITSVIRRGTFQAGHTVAIIEAPFLGTEAEVDELITVAEANEVPLLVDGLAAWYTTEPIEQMVRFVERADETYLLIGWCDLLDGLGGTSLRLVGITPEGEVVHEDAHYWREQVGRDERLAAVRRLQSSPFGDKLIMKNPDGIEGVEICYGVPSHLSAPKVAIGSDRYRTASEKGWETVYELAGFPGKQIQARRLEQIYVQESVVNWNKIGL